MKGIILAAGKGTSLYPATVPVSKPLITVYDKPLIYYPLSLLIDCGIRDILIITPPGEMEPFVRLFGDGEDLGIHISYKEQKVHRGIADAIRLGKWFIGDDSVCLALGDNIFYHDKLQEMLMQAKGDETGASVLGYYVEDPRPFGVVEFDAEGKAIVEHIPGVAYGILWAQGALVAALGEWSGQFLAVIIVLFVFTTWIFSGFLLSSAPA